MVMIKLRIKILKGINFGSNTGTELLFSIQCKKLHNYKLNAIILPVVG